MTTVTTNYGTKTAITLSLASLASSSDFTAGRESTEIDNTTNKYIDAMIEGVIRVGTTPTVDTFIKVMVWGSDTSLGTTAKDVLDGLDSAETITSEGVLAGILKTAKVLHVDSVTTDRDYFFGPIALSDLFGIMPKYWGIFVSHDTGVALNATGGNHIVNYTGIKYDSA